MLLPAQPETGSARALQGSTRSLTTSEIQGSVAVATPDHHRDREAEGCCQCRPGKGEQHLLDHLVLGILPRVRTENKITTIVMTTSSPGSTSLLERERTTQRYPQARVIVLDDDVNTFQHVVNCLRRIIPGMSEDKAWT